MSDVKISQLPATTGLDGTELVPLVDGGVDGGVTMRATATEVATPAINAHKVDPAAHSGTSIAVTPFGPIAATNVQDALEEIVSEAIISPAADAEIAGRFRFRDGFVSRSIAGDTGFGGIIVKSAGDLAAGVFDWVLDSEYGYLFHLTTGPNAARPFACIGIGVDYDGYGLLVRNKDAGRGVNITNLATTTAADSYGLIVENESTVAPGAVFSASGTGAKAAVVFSADTDASASGNLVEFQAAPGGVFTPYGHVDRASGSLVWKKALYLDAAAALNADLNLSRAGVGRWTIRENNAAESGSDVGSDLVIISRTDAGATKTSVVTITRSTGLVTLAGALTVGGALTAATAAVTGAATVGGTLGVTGILTTVTDTNVGGALGVTGNATVTGQLQANGIFQIIKTTATAQMLISASAGQLREIIFATASVGRWTIRTDNGTESGSDAGSGFSIISRTDAGATKATIMAISRASGNITWNDGSNFNLGTTTGTKFGTASTHKLAFYGATAIVQPSATPAAATDLATVLTLANDLRTKLLALGLVA